MPRTPKLIAIDLTDRRLTAVSGGVQRGRLMLDRCVREAAPSDVDLADPRAAGQWIRAVLKKRGASGGGAIVALDRSGGVIKRFEFPGAPDLDAELPGMVRLQMLRQLALPSEGAAIDYLVIGSPDAGVEADGVTVLASALTAERMAWVRQLVKSAGLRLLRVTLKSTGVAAVIAERAEQQPGASLVVTFDGAGCEFLVMAGGSIVFSRHADLPGPIDRLDGDALAETAEAAAREAKRSWVSHRLAPGSPDVGGAIVVGDPGWAESVAERVGEALDLPVQVVHAADRFSITPERQHDGVGAEDGRSGASPGHWVMPLAGVLLEQSVDRPRLNLAREWKAPDPRAGARKAVMLGLMACLIAWGAAYTGFNRQKQDVESELALLEERAGDAADRYRAAIYASARVEHVQRWLGASPNWLAHLAEVRDALPADGAAVLTQANAGAAMRAAYTNSRRTAPYDPAKWLDATTIVKLSITGRARSRADVDRLRGLFVDDDRYLTDLVGADEQQGEGAYAFPFSLVLASNLRDPRPPQVEEADDQGDAP